MNDKRRTNEQRTKVTAIARETEFLRRNYIATGSRNRRKQYEGGPRTEEREEEEGEREEAATDWCASGVIFLGTSLKTMEQPIILLFLSSHHHFFTVSSYIVATLLRYLRQLRVSA